MTDGEAPGARAEHTLAIIEDDANLRWLLEEFARDSGFQFHMYATYDEAFTGADSPSPPTPSLLTVWAAATSRPPTTIELGLLN
jgi:hypothetical protein